MPAGSLSATPASLDALSELMKVNYGESLPSLIVNGSPLMKRLKKRKRFTRRLGGRQFEFPYEFARGENVGMGEYNSYLPGFSGVTNDNLDTLDADTAVVNRSRIYAGAPFDGQWLTAPNKKFFFAAAHQFSRIIESTAEDLRQEIEWQLLGDQTGYRGTVVSRSVVSGHTVVVLQPVTTHAARGVMGTQRFRPNMKLHRVLAAHWATSATASQADSAQIYKVRSVSKLYDRTSNPTITLQGDVTSTLAVGDVLVRFGSRKATSGGSASGGTLLEMQGLFSWIDDGTLTPDLYGLLRSTYPVLNSVTDLSVTGRDATWKRIQSVRSQIEILLNDDRKKEMVLLSEPGVQDAYVPAEGEAAKRYVQDDKAMKIVSGFNDVRVAFLGGATPVSWIRCRDMYYGHLLCCTLDDLGAMWDAEPGTMKEDGLTLRNVNGKDQYYMMLRAYGATIKDLPMYDGRLSGLNGSY